MISNRFAAVCCRAKTSPATNNNYMFIMCGEAAIEHKHTAHTHTHTCSHTHVYCTLVYRQTRMLWQTQTPGSLDRVVVEHVSARDHETTFINRNGANGKERRLNEIVHFQISIGFIPIKRSNITGHSICCVVESRIYLHAVQVNHNQNSLCSHIEAYAQKYIPVYDVCQCAMCVKCWNIYECQNCSCWYHPVVWCWFAIVFSVCVCVCHTFEQTLIWPRNPICPTAHHCADFA